MVNPGFGTMKNKEAQSASGCAFLFVISCLYRCSPRNSSTESPATKIRFRMSPCPIGFPL
jgi:hypothetical protein